MTVFLLKSLRRLIIYSYSSPPLSSGGAQLQQAPGHPLLQAPDGRAPRLRPAPAARAHPRRPGGQRREEGRDYQEYLKD